MDLKFFIKFYCHHFARWPSTGAYNIVSDWFFYCAPSWLSFEFFLSEHGRVFNCFRFSKRTKRSFRSELTNKIVQLKSWSRVARNRDENRRFVSSLRLYCSNWIETKCNANYNSSHSRIFHIDEDRRPRRRRSRRSCQRFVCTLFSMLLRFGVCASAIQSTNLFSMGTLPWQRQ